MSHTLNRRHFVGGAAALTATLAMPPTIGRAQSSSLNIMGNPNSVPQDIRDRFTADTGIQINFRVTTDASQLFNLVASEGTRQTDLAVIAGNRMFPFVAADYVEAVDETALPNLDKLNPVYLEADAQFIGGERYGLPLLSHFGLITSRQGSIEDEDLADLETLFGEKYAGRITYRPGSALLMAMFNLGLQDAWFGFDGDPAPVQAMFEETRAYVIERKHHMRTWYESAAEVQQMLFGNEVDTAFCFPDAAIPMVLADSAITARIPQQGIWGYTENYAFFKDSPNREAAYQFVDYLLGQPQAGASISNHSGSLSTFIDATSGLDEAQIAAMTFPDEDLARVLFLDVRGADDNRFDLLDQYTAGLREA